MGQVSIRNLYNYQKPVVDYIKNTQHSAIFCDMRLGKCVMTIRGLKGFMGRHLIVCPKTVIGTWQEELEMEGITNYAYYTSVHIHKFLKLPLLLPNWVIMNYEAVQKLSEKEQSLFQHIVCDESVRLKGVTTRTTKFFCHAFRNAKKRIVLSGNPAPNTPLEYFFQFKFLKNEWMGCENFYQFRARYFIPGYSGWAWWPKHNTKDLIQKQIAKDAYVLTRKQVGVENEKVYQKRYVEMPPELKKKYKEMEKEFVTTLPSGKKLETKYILPQLSYLSQMAGGSLSKEEMSDFKIKELVNLVEGELKGEQIVIWCKFRWEIEAIKNKLKDCAAITGDTDTVDRQVICNQFQHRAIRYLVSQVSTGKFGINLSVSSTAIYYSNSYVPDDRTQSEARIEINGKKEPLLIIDLITKDSIDEQILKVLKKKHIQSRYFLGDVILQLQEKYK